MKKYISICLLAIFAFASCNDESKLKPSNIEQNWWEDLDMTIPLVKEMYEEYNVGVLIDFDPVRDMLYNITSDWNILQLSKLPPEEVADALDFFKESFLQYFTNAEFIKENFPRRILLSKEAFINASTNPYCPEIQESDSRVPEGIHSLHSIYNQKSFVFSVKLHTINYNEENYNDYKRDNMYIFIANLFERNNLYDELGPDFYIPSVTNSHDRWLSGEASLENKNKPGLWVEDGNDPEDIFAPMEWYLSKGAVNTKYKNPVITFPDDETEYIRLRRDDDLYDFKRYTFPDRERDARMFINQMIYMDQETWDGYPVIVKERFEILMGKFDEWGIDIRSFNPTMEYAFPR